uniref:Uncharacterized protein n=1 Tax=Anguilla anguilla TaxID=7936 RepID=A0A0E9V572_ANGAN
MMLLIESFQVYENEHFEYSVWKSNHSSCHSRGNE